MNRKLFILLRKKVLDKTLSIKQSKGEDVSLKRQPFLTPKQSEKSMSESQP